jgi:5'-deoxynucleotidase YfbR-like HD superfamily hydrolase
MYMHRSTQPIHLFETELDSFSGRGESLQKVTRYQLYPTMFYRTNLLTHSRRLSWLLRAAKPFFKQAFGDQIDAERAIAIALVHDDHEIILGDVQLANKTRMSPGQKENLYQAEIRAIEKTAAQFPKMLGRFVYQDLLLEKLAEETLEAQIVTYFDKLEGLAEAWHEIFGGNQVFATPQVNHYGKHLIPTEIYKPILENFGINHPATAPLFTIDWPLLQPIPPIDAMAVAKASRPHTEASLSEATSYQPYDTWREIARSYTNDEEWQNLFIRKE